MVAFFVAFLIFFSYIIETICNVMITKILLFTLVLAILFLIKEGFLFYKAFNRYKKTKEEQKNMTDKRLLYIGLSIAYVITIIFTGFGL